MKPSTRPVDFPALRTHTAVELLEKELPPLSMVVGRHIPAGLLLLAGDPKVGKSLLMLSLGISVATGSSAWGELTVPHGDVLYLVLEGGERSLRSRIKAMATEGHAPERLHLAYECLNLGDGLATQVESWLYSVEAPRLVIIDTFTAVAPEQRGVNRHQEDYKALEPLGDLAKRWPDTLFVLIHHTRKAESNEVMHRISGSQGLTAATDCNAVFARKPGAKQCVLSIRPRDAEESELLLELDQDTLQWRTIERSELGRLDQRRREVLEWVTGQDGSVTPKMVTEVLGGASDANRQLLMKMAKDGQLSKPSRGRYEGVSHNAHVSHAKPG